MLPVRSAAMPCNGPYEPDAIPTTSAPGRESDGKIGACVAVPSPCPARPVCPAGSGIDAGGSGTRVVVVENGTVTPRPDEPPINVLLTEGFAGHLLQIIKAADVTAAGIGLAGLRQEARAAELSATLTREAGCPVHVTGDADTAQAGAFLGGPGVVV